MEVDLDVKGGGEETERKRGRGNCNQDTVCEKKVEFLKKGKQTKHYSLIFLNIKKMLA